MATSTPPATVAPAEPGRGRRRGWLWLTLAGVLLGASGLVRAWQDDRLEAAARAAETAPFPMSELPRDLGRWKAQGPDQQLDPETLEIAGASSYVARTYTDEHTGVVLSLIVVFGPAERVIGHVPEICFPAVGYSQATLPAEITITPESGPARFRSLVFTKGRGATAEWQEVYYSFRHAGQWSPTAAATRKRLRIEPATYKIQVQRHISEDEGRGLNNPIESLLEELVPELERRIAASAAAQGRSGIR